MDAQAILIKITHDLLQELDRQEALRHLTLQAQLERELGLGSLERVELLERIENAFSVKLPPAALTEAESLADILVFLKSASPKKLIDQETVVAPLENISINLAAAKTLNQVLIDYAKNQANRPHIYFQDETGAEKIIYYGDLFNAACRAAAGLRKLGISEGDAVAIMLPTCDDFFAVFFGILFLGAVPVPIYPPLRANQLEEYAQREITILQNAEVRLLITFDRAERLGKLLKSFVPSLHYVVLPNQIIKNDQLKENEIYQGDSNSPALIQYTSGSTHDPKGVLLSNGNLLANIRGFGDAMQITAHDVAVSWLPLYHDMGLIGAWLGSLYHGVPVTIFSPIIFLTRPETWLWAIHRHQATISAAPNFAFELCVKKIKPEDIVGLDLSSWRLALNGAEMIYPETLQRFTQKFAPYGFKHSTHFPVYGLAESSVGLLLPALNAEPLIDKIDRQIYEKEQRSVMSDDEKSCMKFVCVGKPLANHAARIVDDNHQPVPERQIGNLYFRGPSSMQGYYRNVAATQAAYHEGWWDSGDLAYQADGQFYITGRKKDLIIKAGRNFHPGEIEEVVNKLAGVRKGCVIAFGAEDPRIATEQLVVVAETQLTDEEAKSQLIQQIVETINRDLAVTVDQVVLVPAQTVPKTSSGKLRRAACKQDYLSGKLQAKKLPVWLQLTRLFFRSTQQNFKKLIKNTLRVVYTLYFFGMTTLIAYPLVLIGVIILPTLTAARWLKNICQLLLLFGGISAKINHSEYLEMDKPLIYAVNHASYLDTLLLLAILPAGVAFVVKQELATNIFFKPLLKKLQYVSVARTEVEQGLSDMELIQKLLEQGRSVMIFPEGTFTYASGLRPFRLGAFKLAVVTHTGICPIAIKGMRKLFRDGNWLLNPTRITVTINKPIYAEKNDWHEIARLSSEVRQIIAKDCGEPVLDVIATMPQ